MYMLFPVDLLNLADWIESKPFYINLELDGVKYQIAHAQTYLSPERLWDIRRRTTEGSGLLPPGGQFGQTAAPGTNAITARAVSGLSG